MIDDPARFVELTTALAKKGLALREDSALCQAFLAGAAPPGMTADEVADVCALHRFLYEFTTYAEDCARVLPYMAAALAAPMGGYRAAWQFVKQSESPRLKVNAIAVAGGLPAVWPWLSAEPLDVADGTRSEGGGDVLEVEGVAQPLPHAVLL